MSFSRDELLDMTLDELDFWLAAIDESRSHG